MVEANLRLVNYQQNIQIEDYSFRFNSGRQY